MFAFLLFFNFIFIIFNWLLWCVYATTLCGGKTQLFRVGSLLAPWDLGVKFTFSGL